MATDDRERVALFTAQGKDGHSIKILEYGAVETGLLYNGHIKTTGAQVMQTGA